MSSLLVHNLLAHRLHLTPRDISQPSPFVVVAAEVVVHPYADDADERSVNDDGAHGDPSICDHLDVSGTHQAL